MMATIFGKYGQSLPHGGCRSIQIPANLRVPRQTTGDTLGLNPVGWNFLKMMFNTKKRKRKRKRKQMLELSSGPSMRVGC